MAVPTDEIYEKYLQKAISETNDLGDEIARAAGELQELTPTVEALYTPDIDASLDDQAGKTGFWNAFKPLGDWWAGHPPY